MLILVLFCSLAYMQILGAYAIEKGKSSGCCHEPGGSCNGARISSWRWPP
jgi:hypothetical protein